MKKNGLFLLILPILLIVTAVFLNHARGPFWLASNLDPEYVYLLNAANMAHFQKVGHIDHPGTTVQLLGAITLRTVHFFQFSHGTGLRTDVLARPEFYLNAINTVLITLNALALFSLGLVAYRVCRNLWVSLWLQLAPFFSITLLNSGLTRVSPEPLLLFTGLVLILLMIKSLQSPAPSTKDILLYSLVIGFGIATKVTFLPLLAIPVIIFPGFKKKLAAVVLSIGGFILFTLPIAGMYNQFFGWLFKLLSHKKGYGTGEKGLITLQVYIKNIKNLLAANPFFSYILTGAILVILIILVIPKFRTAIKHNIRFKFLMSVIIAQVAGVLMVGKHAAPHYLVPVLSLSGITLFLIYMLFREAILNKPEPERAEHSKLYKNYPVLASIVLLAVFFIFFNPVVQVMESISQKSRVKENSLAIHREMESKYNTRAKIFYYASSAPAFALKFGNDLSRNAYSQTLQTLYKDTYFYDFLRKDFFFFDYSQKIPFGVIQAKYGDNIVFQGSRAIKIPGIKLKTVFKGGMNEVISIMDPKSSADISRAVDWFKTNVSKGSYLVVPKEFGVGLTTLQEEYKIIPADYRHSGISRFHTLARFLGTPYFCVPAPRYFGKGVISKAVTRQLENFTTTLDIKAVLPEEQHPVFFIGPLAASGDSAKAKPSTLEEIQVWFPYKKLARNLCPAFHILGKKGVFKLAYHSEQDEKVLSVTNIEADKEGNRLCRLGFKKGKEGFDIEISQVRVVHLLVSVNIPAESAQLINKDNFLFIQTTNGKWERNKVSFSGTGWLTYLISKEIQPGDTDVQIGIQFVPGSTGDRLLIKDIKVFLTGKEK